MHKKVLEAKKEEETFSVHYKYHHNWNISNVLNAADLLCRVIFIYTYLFNGCKGMERVSESVFVRMCQRVGTDCN